MIQKENEKMEKIIREMIKKAVYYAEEYKNNSWIFNELELWNYED